MAVPLSPRIAGAEGSVGQGQLMEGFSIGAVVRFHRKAARLTQLELANLAGVGKTSVFDVESGKRTVRLSTLLAILEALGIRLDWNSRLRPEYEKQAESGGRKS